MNIQDNRPVLADGSEIGVYEVRHMLTSDSLSLTYRAWNHHLNAPVLLREFFPLGLARRRADGIRLEAVSDKDRERYANGLSEFLYEAEKLADIEHAAVNKVLNALEFNDTGYQIMNFEQGQRLSAWTESAYSFKEEQLRVIFEALLGGLKAVHEQGLVHGMICPENILLRDNFDPVLINFPAGLLQFARDEGELARELREGYAPAEQYGRDHIPAPADDLYALGATLYRCMTNRDPLSALDRLNLIRDGNKDPMAQWISVSCSGDVPAPWMQAVDRMLRPEATDRPQHVSEIESDLAELSTEPRPDQKLQGFEKFKLGWARKALSGKRLSLAAAAVLILVAGILSVRTFQIPDSVSSRQTAAGHFGEKGSDAGSTEPDLQLPGESKIRAGDLEPGEASVSANPSLSESSVNKPGITSQAETETGLETAGPSPSESESAPPGFPADERTELIVIESEPLASFESHPLRPDATHEKPSVPSVAGEPDPVASAIAGYLEAAERNLTLFNLTTPAEDNAYSNYRAILELDPDNPDALSGINRILERYVWLIESALRRDRIRNAAVYLARAETIAADSPGLDSVRTKLKKLKGPR